MQKVVVLGLLAMLSGCAAQVVASNERSVTVRAGAVQVGEAQAAAEAECAKAGLHARLAMKAGINQFVFDCVH